MNEIVYSPQAKDDLVAIWRYSYDKWGEDKATEYLLQLESGIRGLVGNPMLGKSRDLIREGYRSLQISRHVVFYRLLHQVTWPPI